MKVGFAGNGIACTPGTIDRAVAQQRARMAVRLQEICEDLDDSKCDTIADAPGG